MNGDPVRVDGLTKVFYDEGRGEVRAVDDVSFTCARGEILGLLGANGAGKTTTLRMLCTLLQPTAGRAWVTGEEVTASPERVRASLGFFSASTALYPKLTPRETLRFFASVNRYPQEQVEARVDALILRFGLEKYADSRVEKLSTGMKQKVSIARTIVHDPPVLIFDEPTSGLDVLVARAVQIKIGELRDAGKTVVFSTHAMHEVEKLCDRVAIIHKGRVQADGTPRDLLDQHGQPDLEELFFHLVERAEAQAVEALADDR
jgi:sodium transport system ATP-binding protein